jgi:outer membrane receptor protein involved in Fe transport
MRGKLAVLVSAVVIIFVLLTGSRSASAQVTAGLASISGIVEDSSGSVIAGAQVVVANGANGVHLTLSTSDGGLFNATALAPMTGYTVTVTKAGFATYQIKDIELPVGQNVNIVVPLSIATATQSIQVIGSAPMVDDTKTDVSQVVGTQQILDLPINGRRVDTFVLLSPGVTNDGNFGLLTFRGVANGNTFLLDGNDATDQFFGENAGRTRITSQLSADAVQEFQVVSADFSAEYGRAMGGVVNTVTKSGTNQYHGTGYFFYRNQDFNAADAYSGGLNPDNWRLQSGASLGGPIIKDKLFFFLNGDFTRINSPIVDSIVNANVNSTTETFVPKDATHPNGCDPTVATPAQCAAISSLLPRFFANVPRTTDQDLLFGRIDYHLSDRNTFSASFNYLHFNSPNGLQQTTVASTTGAAINSNGNDLVRVRNGKATWVSILSPTLVNSFRYGYDTDLQSDELNPALNGTLGFLDVSAASVTLGAVNYLPRVEPSETRNEFGDDLSWTRGRHIFKFGVDFATTSDYSLFIQNAHGSYSYTTATAFALDFSGNTTGAKNWTSFSQTFGNPVTNTRINDYDFYVEDQWRVTDKLTANLGLRYEYSQIPQPPVCNPAAPLTCNINSPGKNFMPRLGLAYRLNNKTVVRAGYGLYYARMMGATLSNLFSANGVVQSSISLSGTVAAQKLVGPVFPNILATPPTTGASTTNIQFASPNFSAPYSEQALFGIERQLTPSLSITASYIWSRGIHLYSAIDTNLPPPTNTTTATFAIAPNPGITPLTTYTTSVLLGVGGVAGKRPNASFGGMYEDGNGVASFYNGLALQVDKRFSHGFQASLAYTWSHELDDGQGYGQATQNIFLSNANAWLVNGDFRGDYGDGLTDQPQRLSFAWIWSPTITHRDGAVYKYLVNNWQLSSITTINSSRPYGNPTISVSGTPVPGMFSTFSINGYGLSGRVPFLPESSVWQPATYRDDMRLSKILPFGDRYRLILSFEAFNISNSWSPTTMRTGAFTEAGSCTAVPSTCTLTPVTTFNTGSADALNPDGTEARRLQVSARFNF